MKKTNTEEKISASPFFFLPEAAESVYMISLLEEDCTAAAA